MRPLKKYGRASVYLRGGDREDGFEVEVYGSLVTYYDEYGDYRIRPLYTIKEVVNYKEDKVNK